MWLSALYEDHTWLLADGNKYQYLEVFSEILVLPYILSKAVFRTSLKFRKIYSWSFTCFDQFSEIVITVDVASGFAFTWKTQYNSLYKYL